MKPRLLIMFACLAGMAIWVAMPGPAPADLVGEIEEPSQELQDSKKMLYEWELPGEEPSVELEFDMNVWMDDTDDKNRLYFSISEIHGYYVETLNLDFYYKPTPETTYEESRLKLPVYVNNYIKAGETLTSFMEVVSGELKAVDGDFGTTENWGLEITGYGRARENNPEVLRTVIRASKDAD